MVKILLVYSVVQINVQALITRTSRQKLDYWSIKVNLFEQVKTVMAAIKCKSKLGHFICMSLKRSRETNF